MQTFVVLLMISFLEQDISTDAGIVQTTVVLYSGSGNVYIHASDGTVLVLDTVDGLDALQHIFYRVVLRVFACFQSQTLVTHVLQGNHFLTDFLL